jgi:hypothetical protein
MGKSTRKIWTVIKVRSTGQHRPHVKRDGEFTIHEARAEADRLNKKEVAS